jgi:hypothetical protein
MSFNIHTYELTLTRLFLKLFNLLFLCFIRSLSIPFTRPGHPQSKVMNLVLAKSNITRNIPFPHNIFNPLHDLFPNHVPLLPNAKPGGHLTESKPLGIAIRER